LGISLSTFFPGKKESEHVFVVFSLASDTSPRFQFDKPQALFSFETLAGAVCLPQRVWVGSVLWDLAVLPTVPGPLLVLLHMVCCTSNYTNLIHSYHVISKVLIFVFVLFSFSAERNVCMMVQIAASVCGMCRRFTYINLI
jgi:hypothetical protein